MSETNKTGTKRIRRIRHTGRGGQVHVYLWKQFRFFINESDWKVLPMAAVIAGLVAMVIRNRYYVNMEGSLIGGFALTCVAIWNGCFNSIQSVCRERAIIKREHRSGMHISAYMTAHMIYQFLLCAAQTALTMAVLRSLGVPIPEGFGTGKITPFLIVDIGISMFLITYASDMMSLFLSSISRTTTGAMTLMPFVLIFQLVFSGGVIPLPEWTKPLANFTISNYGIKAITAQGDYNNMRMSAVWSSVSGMRNDKFEISFTVGDVLDKLDNPVVEKQRDREVLKAYTVGEVADVLNSADEYLHLRDREVARPFTLREIADAILTEDAFSEARKKELIPGKTLGEALTAFVADPGSAELLDREIGETMTLGQVLDILHTDELVNAVSDTQVNEPVTVGAIVDFLKNNEALAKQRDKSFTLKGTVGELFDFFGEEEIKNMIETKTAAAAYKKDYENTEDNIVKNWAMLFLFILGFAMLATIALELIDKDKR